MAGKLRTGHPPPGRLVCLMAAYFLSIKQPRPAYPGANEGPRPKDHFPNTERLFILITHDPRIVMIRINPLVEIKQNSFP